MDQETVLQPGAENTPAEFDTAPLACEPHAMEEAAPSPQPDAPKAETSPLLDPEISALLGAELTAILAADWGVAPPRSASASQEALVAVKEAPVAAEAAAAKQAPAAAEAAVAVESPKPSNANEQEPPAKEEKAKKERTAEALPKKRSLGRKIFCFVRRALLLLLVVVLLVIAAAAMACHTIFNGPSQDAREMLYSTFMEPSGTKWIPGLFLSKEEIEAIENKKTPLPPTPEISGQITINTDTSLNGENDEWKDHPDGIRIEHIAGESYTAHVMIIRDPSRVYLGTSSQDFTQERPGLRLDSAMDRYGAVAGINGGAFWDNGTDDPRVGMFPEGLVISQGEVLWNKKDTAFPDNGFAGFNQDNVLIVAKSMTRAQAMELGIRDGVAFGPVLIVDGKGNAEVYNNKSGGQNPRTCIGQRADGAVIFLCIDGRQANSLGGTYADCIDILTEYGAVNACNLDGGSSSAMFYRDTYGKYKEKGEVFMVNNYSLLQSSPRKMPTFFLVAPEKEGE